MPVSLPAPSFYKKSDDQSSDSTIIGGNPGRPGSGLDAIPVFYISGVSAFAKALTAGGTTSISGPIAAATVTYSSGIFNLIFDAASSAGTAAANTFVSAIEQAANIISSALANPLGIKVNININWSGTGGGASAGPSTGQFISYQTVYNALNSLGDPSLVQGLNASTLTNGGVTYANVAVWNAQLKAWGLLAPTNTASDGVANFSTDIASTAIVGVALHELTHAIGRIPYGPDPDVFDLFRFTSAGTRLFSGSTNSAPAAYFSLDGGVTKLADYGRTSDTSDFLNGGVQDPAGGPYDPFDEFYYVSNTQQGLSQVDLKQLEAVGFQLASTTPPPPTSTFTVSAFLAAAPTATSSMSILDSAINVQTGLDNLNPYVAKIASIQLTDPMTPITITAAQSVNDHATLAKISRPLNLVVNAQNAGDTIKDASNATSTLVGLSGQPNSFDVWGAATLTNFDSGPTVTDTLMVEAGATAAIILASNYAPASASLTNNGVVSLTSAASGLTMNVAASLGTGSFTLTDAYGMAALTGSSNNDNLNSSGAGNTLVGSLGADIFSITGGSTTVTDLGRGADVLKVSGGAATAITLAASWTATSASSNTGGTVTITDNVATLNLSAATGATGYTVNENYTAAASITGSAYADNITAGNFNDTVNGGAGIDTIIGGKGADRLTGGAGSDTFYFASGDSGQTSTTLDVITDFAKGATGDNIFFTASDHITGQQLFITGMNAAASSTTGASINSTTGVATMPTGGFKNNLANDISMIVRRFLNVGGGTDVAGDMAFFRVGTSGSYYLLISDGKDSMSGTTVNVSAGDQLIQLSNVTSINSIGLNAGGNGHLSIMT